MNSRDLAAGGRSRRRVCAVSPSWTRVLGYAPDELLGGDFRKFVHPDDLAQSEEALATAVRSDNLTAFENRVVAKSDEVRWISWNTSLEDRLVYAYGRDITAGKAAGAGAAGGGGTAAAIAEDGSGRPAHWRHRA
ncbi:MAG: PAS domain-containing protein [Rhodopseudomonas palustris]|nr:PAS domain-containing protein [Rhodopseudomonas palustris]